MFHTSASVVFVLLDTHVSEPVGPVGQAMIVLSCLAIGGFIALFGLGYLQTYNRVRKTDPTSVRRLTDTDSEVELSGTVQAHERTIESPFTDTECVACEWEAQRYRGGGDGANWSNIDSGEERHSFWLADGTGDALIDPRGGTLDMAAEATVVVEPDESPPLAVEEYISETDGIDPDHDRKRRYFERRLDVGEDVHVFGPIRRIGRPVDMPAGADAIIGVEDPDRWFTVGEDNLSDLVDHIKEDHVQFTITPGSEREAERRMLKRGLIFTAFGVVFGLIPLVFVVVL